MSHWARCIAPMLLGASLLTGCAGGRGVLTPRKPEAAVPAPPRLTVAYPRVPPDSTFTGNIPDSLFLFGAVNDPRGTLTVNGTPVPIHPGGGWLAWIGADSLRRVEEEGEQPAGLVFPVTLRFRSGSNIEDGVVVERLRFFQPERTGPWADESRFDTLSARLVVRDSSAKIRCGWPGTYDLFPPAGTVLFSDGRKGATRRFWRVPLGAGEVGWIEERYVSVETPAPPRPNPTVIHYVTTRVEGRRTVVRIPLKNRVPFRVRQTADDRIELTLYGAVSWTDLILQPFRSRVVDELRWSQVDPTTYRLTARLRPGWFWGWETAFNENNTLLWTIVEAPELGRKPLHGLTVFVDPGHGGGNTGAIGPTGLDEKDAVLPLSRAIAEELRRAGAKVVLSREEDVAVRLNDRIRDAREAGADLVLSVHFNGLPQGANPFRHHGASLHYVHAQSKPLAESLYREITRTVGREGDGLRYQDLAIPRLTFCPAVLIESGFLLHPEEEALAKSEAFRKKFARGVRTGLEDYLEGMRNLQRASRR